MSAAYAPGPRAWATRLRLDANQAWDLHDATAFARAVADLPVDYLEEPLQNPAQLPKFARDTGAPIALDETLQSGLPGRAGEWNLRAVVLKPTALGGFARAREIGAATAAAGAKSVVSSLFESSIGLAHLAHFAASLDNASTHHGLDTAGAFSSDTLTAPLRVEDGRLSAPPLDGLVRLMNESPLREALHV
ncbi:MAG: enolase C-terminal domain-like protein [Kiritimatiellia bacterium]